jgi:hypothetical protein
MRIVFKANGLSFHDTNDQQTKPTQPQIKKGCTKTAKIALCCFQFKTKYEGHTLKASTAFGCTAGRAGALPLGHGRVPKAGSTYSVVFSGG